MRDSACALVRVYVVADTPGRRHRIERRRCFGPRQTISVIVSSLALTSLLLLLLDMYSSQGSSPSCMRRCAHSVADRSRGNEPGPGKYADTNPFRSFVPNQHTGGAFHLGRRRNKLKKRVREPERCAAWNQDSCMHVEMKANAGNIDT